MCVENNDEIILGFDFLNCTGFCIASDILVRFLRVFGIIKKVTGVVAEWSKALNTVI